MLITPTFKMATGNQWETVGKNTKKTKNQGPAGAQGKKKGVGDNMPTIQAAGKRAILNVSTPK